MAKLVELDIFDAYLDALAEGIIELDEQEIDIIEKAVSRNAVQTNCKKNRDSRTQNKTNYDKNFE